MKTIQEIDLTKYQIQAKYTPLFKKIFYHMAADAKSLYLVDKRINAEQLAKNYNPEFLTVIRNAQRETIKVFGFDLREEGESKKNLKFKTEKYKALIDYHIESKDIEQISNIDAIEKINRQFGLDAALFVANSSEEQVAYIYETNVKEISDAERLAIILFFQQQGALRKKIEIMQNDLRRLEFEGMLGGSQAIAAAKKKRLREKIASTEAQLQDLLKNKDNFIANKIQTNIESHAPSRSELIASQNVGMAESWSRNKEASLINQNIPELKIKKKWQSILDNRTRPTHIVADNQVVGQNEKFNVGGHKADFPRDPSLPIEETANCRCVAFHYWGDDDLMGTP